MADNKEKSEKKEPVKYRFGQNDIDLNKYILNLGHNVQSYIDSQGWNDGQKEEFMNAYNQYLTGLKDQLANGTSRFSTDDFGTIVDSTGALSNTDNDDIDPVGSEYYYDNDGNRITTDDYNLLKKRKQKNFKTFAANREVATYFNKIGRAIGSLPKEAAKGKEKFSISKHGFLADWQKRNGSSGEKIDLTPYLDMDKYDPETKKRARTNRIAYLQQELSNYINSLDGDYDFEGSSFKSMDDYKAKLQSLIDNMNDGWSNSDMIAANQAGIGGSFYNYFFTEDETPGMTTEEANAREEEAKKKAQQDAQNKWIDEQIAIYDKNGYQWHHNNQHNLGKVDSKYWSPETGWNGEAFRNSFVEGSPEWTKYYNGDTKQFDYQTYFNDYLANPFSKEGKRAIAGLIGNGYAQQLQGGKYQGMYYIPQYERDRRTNSGLIYDPLNGRLFYTFIGDIPDQWNKMIEEYKLANGLIERRDSYKFKEGGSIEMMQLGGGFDANAWMEEDRQKGLEAKGAKNGRTAELQEYKYLQGSESQRRVQVQKLRDWLNQVNAKDYHTQAYNNFRANHVDAEGNVNIPVPGTRRAIQGTFENLIKDLGIFKEGGSLNIDKVRKFKEAGKITNTTSKANWFADMYSSPEMTKWLNTFNVDNFEDFNNLQRSWATNKTNTGYSTGMSHIATPKNQGVWDRQALWNQTGTNAAIERAFNDGKITRAGVSGDNKENNYQDGFFGEQEFLRHGGTKESWAGKDNELKALQASLAERGLSYTLDDATGMYLLGKLQGNAENNTTNPVQPQGTPGKTTVKTPEVKSNDGNAGGVDANYLNNVIMDNPTLRYGLPRALYANKMNRKITDLAIASEKPFLQDPFQFHRNVQSDLDAEMQGQRSAANLSSIASKPLTSDGNLQTAAMLEAQAKGQEFINQGKEKSNAAYRQSSELAWQQEKENAKNRHNTALVNKESLLKSDANKSKYEQAYLSKKYTNWDTLFQQLEYDAKTKAAENKAYEQSFAQSDIHDAVTYDLENQARNAGVELTPEQLTAWNKVLSGEATYSTLADDTERRNYLAASKIASQLENQMLRNYLGIPASKYSAIRTLASPKTGWQADILEAKNGAKIAVAGIQAKTKDAERFQRQIKESIERNEKALDRLSKSMYGYVKALIVK